MSDFHNVISPLRIGALTLRNRFVMGAMHTRLETLDHPSERIAAFYSARAKGEAGLILTGGYSPVPEGVMEPDGPLFNEPDQIDQHRVITNAVHKAGGLIALQILHAGRYAKIEECVSPSGGRARINRFSSRALSNAEAWATIDAFVTTAELARQAGYDGVEIMGSEGYLINQFTASRTNTRNDEFGGCFENRVRFALEIVRAIKTRLGRDFLLIYRISAIDLVEGGMSSDEVSEFAQAIEAAGADVINTGIGWHESTVPTIAASVPRGAWLSPVKHIKNSVSIPVIASNRINTPQMAERIIASGIADLVSLARPLLADPDFPRKTRQGDIDRITPCIGCNQACLDYIFTGQTATCLVNPLACRETDFPTAKTAQKRRLAVVGAGPAGLAFAITAAQRGHRITLFEASDRIGGQIKMASRVPGKAEFNELLRYFQVMLAHHEISVNLNSLVGADDFRSGAFDAIVVATGVSPRRPVLDGIDHPMVVSYDEVLSGGHDVGPDVAILGSGGIGFDVAEYLTGDPEDSLNPERFLNTWGITPDISTSAGPVSPPPVAAPAHRVHMFQRKEEAPGRKLGKSTGWILKEKLRRAGVVMLSGVTYQSIDDRGLHYLLNGKARVLPVNTIVLCTGQESNRGLYDALEKSDVPTYLIGGARQAGELDARRAIDEATRLAYSL